MSKNRLQKKNGFMLIEMLVAIVVVVMLAVGMGTGLNAAVKAYKESTQQSDDAVLTDILNTTMGDMLRYCEDVKLIKNESGEITGFTFTNYDYGIKDGWLAVENGKVVIKYQKEGESEPASIPLVNDGAYTEGIQVGDLVVTPDEEGKYYDISYSLIRNGEKDQYTFRVRQANADIVAIIEDQGEDGPSTENPGGNGGQSGEGEETESDSQITVTFDCNIQKGEGDRKVFENVFGDKTSSVSKVVNGSFNTNIGNVVRAGYALNGWYAVSQSGSRKTFNKYNPDEPETIKVSDIGSYVAGDSDTLILYAEWEETKYQIVYKDDDGNGSVRTKSFNNVTINSLPIYQGGDFKNEYTVQFELNNGNINGNTTNPESTATYKIDYWSSEEKGEGTKVLVSQSLTSEQFLKLLKEQNSESIVTLHAHWVKETGIEAPQEPVRDKWTFYGWTNANGTKVTASNIKSACTLYALWGKNVTFYDYFNGVKEDLNLTKIYYEDKTAISMPDVNQTVYTKRSDYVFTGWSTTTSGEPRYTVNQNYIPDATGKEMWAHWNPICDYSLKFDANLSTTYSNMPGDQSNTGYSAGKSITYTWSQTPKATGYIFKGWMTGSTDLGNITSYTLTGEAGKKVEVTLKASWERIKVSFNTNGGDAVNDKEASTSGGNVVLPSATRTGYDLKGWYKDNTFVGKNGDTYPSSGKLTNHVTLRAEWKEHTYKVIFHSNNGYDTTTSQEFNYDEWKNLKTNDFSDQIKLEFSGLGVVQQVKCTFNKWTTNADGTGTSYSNTQKVGNLTSEDGKEIHLYAQWTGTSQTLPIAYGYCFLGWSKNQNAEIPDNGYYAGNTIGVTSGTTLYPVYSPDPNFTSGYSLLQSGKTTSYSSAVTSSVYIPVPYGCRSITVFYGDSSTLYWTLDKYGGKYMCEYSAKSEGSCLDYWSFESSNSSKTVSINANTKYIRFTVLESLKEICYVKDDTHGLYLYKGNITNTSVSMNQALKAVNRDSEVSVSGYYITDYLPIKSGCTKILVYSGSTYSSYSMLNQYKSSKWFIDYWTANGSAREITLTNASETAYVRATFPISNSKNCFIYDMTNGVFIYKGSTNSGNYNNVFLCKGYALDRSGTKEMISASGYVCTDYIEVPSTCKSVKVYGGGAYGTYSLINSYTSSYSYNDWFTATSDPRSITIGKLGAGKEVKYVRCTFIQSKLDDCFILDETNNTYLYKGKNVK